MVHAEERIVNENNYEEIDFNAVFQYDSIREILQNEREKSLLYVNRIVNGEQA